MNTKEIMSAKEFKRRIAYDEKLRIKVAKLAGYTRINIDEPNSCYCPNQGMPGLCKLPDFPNDLNFMHDVEEDLTKIQLANYTMLICGKEHDRKIIWSGEDAAKALCATAKERAEAYVKVVKNSGK